MVRTQPNGCNGSVWTVATVRFEQQLPNCSRRFAEPGSKRTGPGREPEPGADGVRGHGFSQIARENSKYPTGTPFVFIFLYLNTSNFHLISNVGRMFELPLVPFNFWIRQTLDLNISFTRKRNWTYEYITFIPNGRRTYSNHYLVDSINISHLNL